MRTIRYPFRLICFLVIPDLGMIYVTQRHSAVVQSVVLRVNLYIDSFVGLTPHRAGRTAQGVPRIMAFLMTGIPWAREDYLSSCLMVNLAHLVGITAQLLKMIAQSFEYLIISLIYYLTSVLLFWFFFCAIKVGGVGGLGGGGGG